MEEFCIYILTNKRHTTFYVGMTHCLQKRIWQHKNKETGGFSARYNIDKLVYYESGGDLHGASRREAKLKRTSRRYKKQLITKMNPEWKDLYWDLGPA